ncbi:hypothetical protein [Microlunatus sp. Y2014]|uniref:hypothetical protein n=1 Tax=Microlunatus sp. Y2014 TaxID=3418488 RepID=UPI003DA7267F
MMAQLAEAAKHGVDVIWWTDHDWRAQAYGYYPGMSLNGTNEDMGVRWNPREPESVVDPRHKFSVRHRGPHQRDAALRVEATAAGAAWGSYFLWPKGGNSFYTTNLSDTTISVDVQGDQLGEDAEAVIEVGTSYRPATAGRPAGEYVLQYRLGATAGRELAEPLVGVVTTRSTRRWQTLSLNPLADIKSFWPDLVAEDSVISRIWFGVRARNRSRAVASFDRAQFHRTRDQLEWPVLTQRALMDELAPRYPTVRQHLASEVSMVRHLNVFMPTSSCFPIRIRAWPRCWTDQPKPAGRWCRGTSSEAHSCSTTTHRSMPPS